MISSHRYLYKWVAAFICRHVRKNKGSTRSVGNLLSALKRCSILEGVPWMTKKDELKLMGTISQLKLEDLSPSRRKRSLRVIELVQMIDILDLSDDKQLLKAVMLATGHDGLLRTAELLFGSKVNNILWEFDRNSFRYELPRSKTHRSGEPEYITYCDYGPYSAVRLMRMWFDRHGLWSKPYVNVFPAVSRSGKLNFSRVPSGSWWRKVIKTCCASIGLDSTRYSGHSLRAGGATDLFVARVPYYIIKKMGRWKSDAAMLYYRDDEDIRDAVTEAFTNLYKVYANVK